MSMATSTSLVMFQKSMPDLVKGIRAQKRDTSEYISQAIVEIKTELKSTDIFVKAEAVRKLTYLQMIGYNVSWASFGIVEVMSQQRFAHKRIGYLAANQSFTETTDVILLTTNLFKKEFERSGISSPYETGLAINSIANIVTHDLARDCMGDMVNLMNHAKPYVRKKAVLAMYKLYVKYPQGLRLTFDKLKDRLDDPEVSVTSCAVNVICELANKNPKNYLAMAPKFFRLLTTSANNWMLIKVVKLLGSLVSEEPRLARKLLEPLATIIQNTTAKSLQYECIHTVTLALPYTKRDDGSDAKNVPTVVKQCSDALRQFIEDPDQNLKYLGLVGLVQLMDSHPKAIVDHRELVLKCLNDDDVTIRTRALELLAGMVTKKTIMELVKHLLQHISRAEGAYRDELISKILYMGSRGKFAFISDFAWYTSVLLDLASMQGTKHGKEVAEQLIEIALRVDTVRPFTVEAMLSMLLNEDLILGHARNTVSEVLRAAAWIVGEYSDIVTKIAKDESEEDNDEEEEEEEDNGGYWIEGPTGEEIRSQWRNKPLHSLVLSSLLHPRATNLPRHVQACYMQAAMKIFIRSAADCNELQLIEIVGIVRCRISVFLQSVDLEVQERASTFRHLLDDLDILPMDWEEHAEEEKISEENKPPKEVDLLFTPLYTTGSVQAVDEKAAKHAKQQYHILNALTAEVFYAVHSKAQRRVPIPTDVDLEVSFNENALNNLLNIEDPASNITLSTLSFIALVTYDDRDSSHQTIDEEQARISRLVKSSFEGIGGGNDDDHNTNDNEGGGGGLGYSENRNNSTAFMNIPERDPEERLFYLGGGVKPSSSSSDVPDVIPEQKRKGKKDKGKKGSGSGKTSSKGAEIKINKQDMLPAGAMVDSDDDDRHIVSKKTGVKKASNTMSSSSGTATSTKKKSKKEDKFDENVLGDVDLTTPLKPGEILPVRTHHVVVASSSTPSSSSGLTDDRDKKKKKSSKTDSDSKEKIKKKTKTTSNDNSTSVKEKSSTKKSAGVAAPVVGDLLGLDWPSSSPSSSTLVQTTTATTITTDEATTINDSKKKKSTKDNIEKSEEKYSNKKKSSSKVWLPLYSERNVDAFYALSRGGAGGQNTKNNSNGSETTTTITLHIRIANNSTDGSKISTDITFLSTGPLHSPQGSVLRAANNLNANTEVQSTLEFISDTSIIQSNFLLKGTFQCTIHSLLGSETTSSNVVMSVPVCITFTPFKASEEIFSNLLAKSSSKWGNSSTKIAYSSKTKTALKAIANYLHAHIVELEISKAASMAAKTPSGASICCLAKQGRDDFINIDIKVLGTNKTEGQIFADAISASLSELSL